MSTMATSGNFPRLVMVKYSAHAARQEPAKLTKHGYTLLPNLDLAQLLGQASDDMPLS